MKINLANVNISIDQFQRVASGTINAGEVRLASETTLDKVNNHTFWTSFNNKTLSHQEVLAVKNAFIRALTSNGVAPEEIARVRRELGLAVDGDIDSSLHKRSLKPLTRQQVREILDRNAATINEHTHAHTIRTSAELNAGKGEQVLNDRKNERDTVNNSLDTTRRTREHQRISLIESLVSGDVDFRSYKESQEILKLARQQLALTLKNANGQPSDTREAVVKFRQVGNNQHFNITTGQSEAAFVRRLQNIIVRLNALNIADQASINVRDEFLPLNAEERVARLDTFASIADGGGFKVRTAAIALLTEAGIDDWNTLSLINRITDQQALALAKGLAQLNGARRGNALRQHNLLQTLAEQANPGVQVQQHSCASIPATSAKLWNKTIRDAIVIGKPENIPHDIIALTKTLEADLRTRFGKDILGFDETGLTFIKNINVKQLIPDDMAEPATAENIRERLENIVNRMAAERVVTDRLDKMVLDAKGPIDFGVNVFNCWLETRPELHARLLNARTTEEVDSIINENREFIQNDVKKRVAIHCAFQKVESYYKEMLAKEMGISSTLFIKGLDIQNLTRKAGDLADDIAWGKVALMVENDSDEAYQAAVEKAFKDFAAKAVKTRMDVMKKVDALPINNVAKDYLKEQVFTLTRPEKFDLTKAADNALKVLVPMFNGLDALLPNGDKVSIYNAMKPIGNKARELVRGMFPPGAEVGAEEYATLGQMMMAIAIRSHAGMFDKLMAFFARPDVKKDNFYDSRTPAVYAESFTLALPESDEKADLIDSLGKTSMPPLHAQALMKAFDDAGLGNRSIAERMAILRPSHPAGLALANALNATPGPISPSRLREIATPILRDHANDAPAARSQEDAARMETLLQKYSGGLSPADQQRLRTFAEELDYSRAATPASEKAIARRLDEICGFGKFGNPATSASRRALAAGFTEADLPMLNKIYDNLRSFGDDDDAVDDILNPNSDFRRAWDAALLRLANNDQAQKAGLSVEQKIAVATAISACDGNAELIAAVTADIKVIILNDEDNLRSENGIKERVDAVRGNLEKINTATANYPEALAMAKQQTYNYRKDYDLATIDGLILQALNVASADPECLKIVANLMHLIVRKENARLRRPEEVTQMVQGILANVTELRAAAKGDDVILREGVAQLGRLGGKSLPQGVFTAMLQAVKNVPINAIKGFKANSNGLALHKAIMQFTTSVEQAFRQSGAAQSLRSAPEQIPCREFICSALLHRVSVPTLRTIHTTLHGEKGKKLLRIYDLFAYDRINVDGRDKALQDGATMMGIRLGQFDGYIAALLNLQNADYQGVMPFTQEFDVTELQALEIGQDILANLPRGEQNQGQA